MSPFIIVQHLPIPSGSLPESSCGPPRPWLRLAGAQPGFSSLRPNFLAVHTPDAITEQESGKFKGVQHRAMHLSRVTTDSWSVQ